jgi:hypothetical protein
MQDHGKWARQPGQAKQPRQRVIAAGRELYDRDRHLARILPLGPDEIADRSTSARRRILARLARALRAERNRGRAGHWTYDLNRHIALAQAYEAERRDLAALGRVTAAK